MAQYKQQEMAEYYRWLLKIERNEFEKELLDIVSKNLCKLHLNCSLCAGTLGIEIDQ